MLASHEIQTKNSSKPEEIVKKLKNIHDIKLAEIQTNLEEKIRLHEEKTQEKIEQLDKEMYQQKKELSDYKAMVLEIGSDNFSIQNDGSHGKMKKLTDELLRIAIELKQRSKNGSQQKASDCPPNGSQTEKGKDWIDQLTKETKSQSMDIETNGNKKVLVIEDDPVTTKIISHFLEKEKYSVSIATNGENGLEQIKKEKPDLILLDLMLPIVNGHQILAVLKKENGMPDIPVIVLSALSQEPDVLNGYEEGATDYITKPFSPQVLMAKIKSILSSENGQYN